MKKWLLLFAASITLAACGTATDQAQESSEAASSQVTPETVSATIVVSVDGEEIEGGTVEVEVEPGTVLMDVMAQQFEIEETGGYINSINSIKQDDEAKKYWLYDVNGEMGMVGANDLELQDGDLVEFNLSATE